MSKAALAEHAGAMDARPAAHGPAADEAYDSDPAPVVAHRGGAGLALENTLDAFEVLIGRDAWRPPPRTPASLEQAPVSPERASATALGPLR